MFPQNLPTYNYYHVIFGSASQGLHLEPLGGGFPTGSNFVDVTANKKLTLFPTNSLRQIKKPLDNS